MPRITYASTSTQKHRSHQEPFGRVAALLAAALLVGAGGGFVLAAILTLTRLFAISLGPWWIAVAQAHGHLQLYGWAGLFVLGVTFHFFPRLRGTPLALPRLVPWLLGTLITGLLLRAISQPLVLLMDAGVWHLSLVLSGLLECFALLGAIVSLALTALHGPLFTHRPAFTATLPLMAGALCALGVATLVNLANMIQAALATGLVQEGDDMLNVTLGLFGFLVPMALAMSVRSLPMYAGLKAFPNRLLWPFAAVYMAGLVLTSVGTFPLPAANSVEGAGLTLIGAVILLFIGEFLRLMRTRGRLPQQVAQLATNSQAVAQAYTAHVSKENQGYGPFVALVASAYLWALLGGVLLVSDGLAFLFGTEPLFALDAIRHSFAVGFIALLLAGVASRMLPGFSGGTILSPALVSATLWFGNAAALFRVGSLLLAPVLTALSSTGQTIVSILFGLSGPLGLAFAICLAINLWPAIYKHQPQTRSS